METTTALLRVAARITGSSAAIVARPTDAAPLAAWNCDAVAAGALLRAVRRADAFGSWSFRTLPLTLRDGDAAELILVAPTTDVDHSAVSALAVEIGAVCDPDKPSFTSSAAIERLSESIDRLGEAIAILDTPGDFDRPTNFLYVNAAFTQLFGYAAEELVAHSVELIRGPLTDRERLMSLRERIVDRQPARGVIAFYRKDGLPVWVEIASMPVLEDSATIPHVVTFRDVTARKHFEDALAAEKQKLQTTLAAIADAVVTVLADGRVEFVNDAAKRLLGIERNPTGALVGAVLELLDVDAVPIDLLSGFGADGVRRGSGFLITPNGTIDVGFVASRIDGEEQAIVVVLRDITAENRIALRLSFEASHDPLTGLQNRRAFLDRLEQAVQGARERGEHHAVAFLDLDRFKIVNDRLGHAVGDRLLRELGQVMGRVVRGGDVLARIGGDEFGLLLANCRLEDALRVVDKIRSAVNSHRPEHHGVELDVGISAGVAPIEADTTGATHVLAAADAACYQAKAAGRNATVG